MALLGHLYLPFTAGEDFKPETTGADFRFSMAHTLNERSSLSYNIGAQWGDDSPEVARDKNSHKYRHSRVDKRG